MSAAQFAVTQMRQSIAQPRPASAWSQGGNRFARLARPTTCCKGRAAARASASCIPMNDSAKARDFRQFS